MLKVLVFGGAGFLGNRLNILLKEEGFQCYTVSRSHPNSDFKLDISDFRAFDTLPKDFFDVVVNCATVLPGGHYLDSNYLDKIYKTNILGTQNICNWIHKQQTIKKIINCSTLVVVKKPWNAPLDEVHTNTYPVGNHVLYCASKLTQELIFSTFATSNNLVLTQIRFSSLYGEEMAQSGILCSFLESACHGKSIQLTNGDHVYADFLHVQDAARIVMSCIHKDIDGILNGASGEEISIHQLAITIAKVAGVNIKIENTNSANAQVQRAQISVQKLKTVIDIDSFTSLKTGIQKMLG